MVKKGFFAKKDGYLLDGSTHLYKEHEMCILLFGKGCLLRFCLPFLFQHLVSDRRSDEQGRESTEYDTQNHREREAADTFTT